MAVRLKKLSDQTIVITGASSGIGLATARMAAGRGAAVVLVARDEPSLATAVTGIREAGGRAEYRVADVADLDAMEGVARFAVEKFGGIDTWVNDAGASIYGTQEQTPIEDQRRLFDTNYWGVVHGSLVAARRLKSRGGAIINVGSVLSDRAIAYQGTYSATKHAVKGFTDALRMELRAEGAPISVTLVKPAAIDSLFAEHARNLLGSPGLAVPPPTYDPKVVARAILFAATTPRRDLYVGGGGLIVSVLGTLFPRATDALMAKGARAAQTSLHAGRPGRRDNLAEGRPGGEERSSLPGPAARQTSLVLEAQMHPVATLALVAGGVALVAGALAARRSGHGRLATFAMDHLPRGMARDLPGRLAGYRPDHLPGLRDIPGYASLPSRRDLPALPRARDLPGYRYLPDARDLPGRATFNRLLDLLPDPARVGAELVRRARRSGLF